MFRGYMRARTASPAAAMARRAVIAPAALRTVRTSSIIRYMSSTPESTTGKPTAEEAAQWHKDGTKASKAGDLTTASELYEKALKARIELFGAEHEETERTRNRWNAHTGTPRCG
jgi:hypothetical protein